MKTIEGPAIFLAQFAGTGPHLQKLNDICNWARECGHVGVEGIRVTGKAFDDFAAGGGNSVALKTLGLQ